MGSASRPWYRKRRYWALAAVAVVVVVAAISSGNQDDTSTTANRSAETKASASLYPDRPDRRFEDHEPASVNP